MKKENKQIDYSQEIKELLKFIGGMSNVVKIYNCTTRIRIVLTDYSQADIKKLSECEWNNGVIFNGNEIQIIMKQKVNPFMQSFYQLMNAQASDVLGKFVPTEKKNLWDKIVSTIVAVITPLVPYFLILGLNSTLNSLITTQWSGNSGSALTDVGFFGEFSKILNVLTRGVNAALPLLICWSIFKLMKQPEILGIMLGLSLMLPSIWTGINPDGTPGGVISQIDLTLLANQNGFEGNILQIAEQAGYALHLFGAGVAFPYLFSFDGQVVPSILVAVIGVWISIGMSKIGKPNSFFQNLFFYFLVLLASFLVAFLFIAPAAFFITSAVSTAFSWLMTASVIRYLAPALIGLALPLFALFGLDNIYVLMGFIQYYTPDKNNNSTSAITTLGFFATYVMAGIAAYVTFVLSQKKCKELRSSLPGVISSGIGGVILPSAGINVNLRHLYPWISTAVGAGCGAIFLAITQTTTVLGTGSFLAILSTQNASTMVGMETIANLGMLWMTLAILLAIGVSVTLTLVLGRIKWFKERSEKLLALDYPEFNLENQTVEKTPKQQDQLQLNK